jgi:hypothetical protein
VIQVSPPADVYRALRVIRVRSIAPCSELIKKERERERREK